MLISTWIASENVGGAIPRPFPSPNSHERKLLRLRLLNGVPKHATADSAYETVYTVIHDLGQGKDIAWIHGAVWPPVGTVVELESPERHALVVGIRLVLEDGSTALVRVDVQDPGEGELIARDAATRMLAEDAVPSTGEALLEAHRPHAVGGRQSRERPPPTAG